MHSFTSDSAPITKHLQALPSWAISFQSSSRSHLLKSSIIISFHLFFCPPADLFPMSGLHTRRHLRRWQPSILCERPSHLNLLRMIFISTLSRPARDRNSVFLILSHHDTPRTTRRHPVMKACTSLKWGQEGPRSHSHKSRVVRTTALNKHSWVSSLSSASFCTTPLYIGCRRCVRPCLCAC